MIGHRPHMGVNKKGNLEIGGVDTVELAETYGTPLYATEEDRIRARYREIHSSFASNGYDVKVKYACKANTSLAVLKILKKEGAGADVLSLGEMKAVLYVGMRPNDIIFTGNNKTDEEILFAIGEEICLNLDSLHELERIKRICRESGKKARISFRINPAISPDTHPHLATGLRESKFGIQQKESISAYGKALKDDNLQVEGIHMHIGSQILDPGVYGEAASKLMGSVCKIKEELKLDLSFIDVGGGFGVRYREEDRYVSSKEFAQAIFPPINKAVEECGLKKPTIFIEPGRYILADSTILLTRVNTVKKGPYKKFIGVDCGFNTLLRPMLYGGYHEVLVANKMREKPVEVVSVAGNVCESGDILASDRSLPEVEEGDLISILDTGAYGLIMASQYNFRPRPAAVLISEGSTALIRKREEFDDLIEREIIPDNLRD